MINIQNITTKYIVEGHLPTSWEVKVHIEKWLKAHGYHTAMVDFNNGEGYVIFINGGIGLAATDMADLDIAIPNFIKLEKEKEEKKTIKELAEIREWLDGNPPLLAPHNRKLVKYHKVITQLRDELEAHADKGEVLPCGLGDLIDNMKLYKHVLKGGDNKEAQRIAWSMETGARDYIPKDVYEYISQDED